MKKPDICCGRYPGSDARMPINRSAKPKDSCLMDRSSRVVPMHVRPSAKPSGFMSYFVWTTARATGRSGCDEAQRIYGVDFGQRLPRKRTILLPGAPKMIFLWHECTIQRMPRGVKTEPGFDSP